MKPTEKFTDESPMPFGEFKGTKLANVPASRLLWYWDQPWLRGPLKDYIKENFQSLKQEIKNDKR
jgi:uncharacterized protein (DUF3820 family)